MVLALLEQVKSKEAELQTKSAEIDAKEFKIQSLTHELAYLRRMRYGVKSEALTTLQRDLFTDHWNEDIAAIEAELKQLQENQPVVTVIKPQRPRAGRQPLPDHLPRIEHHHEPESCHCGHCGHALTKIRDDITEQIDVEPAKFFVHRHLCPVGTSARNMLVGAVRPSRRHRFLRR